MPFSPPHLLEVWPLEKRMGLQNCIVELRGVQDDLQGHNAPAQIHKNPPTGQKLGKATNIRQKIFPVIFFLSEISLNSSNVWLQITSVPVGVYKHVS